MQKRLLFSIKFLIVASFIFGTFSVCFSHPPTEPAEQTTILAAADSHETGCCSGEKLLEKHTLISKTTLSQPHAEKIEKLSVVILPQHLSLALFLHDWPGLQTAYYQSLLTRQELSVVMRS